jgi:hypothetical protein
MNELMTTEGRALPVNERVELIVREKKALAGELRRYIGIEVERADCGRCGRVLARVNGRWVHQVAGGALCHEPPFDPYDEQEDEL